MQKNNCRKKFLGVVKMTQILVWTQSLTYKHLIIRIKDYW